MTKDFLLRLTEEHYGAGAFPVYGRLLEEQRLTRGGPLLPMWHCTAALRRAFGEDSVLVLGCTNDSLLAHLLGATPVNPLPPHYHCPNCHHLSFDAHADDGRDLPDLVCPECGAPMAADGHMDTRCCLSVIEIVQQFDLHLSRCGRPDNRAAEQLSCVIACRASCAC